MSPRGLLLAPARALCAMRQMSVRLVNRALLPVFRLFSRALLLQSGLFRGTWFAQVKQGCNVRLLPKPLDKILGCAREGAGRAAGGYGRVRRFNGRQRLPARMTGRGVEG